MAVAIRGGVVSETPSEPCAWPTFDEDLRKAKHVVERAADLAAFERGSDIRAHFRAGEGDTKPKTQNPKPKAQSPKPKAQG